MSTEHEPPEVVTSAAYHFDTDDEDFKTSSSTLIDYDADTDCEDFAASPAALDEDVNVCVLNSRQERQIEKSSEAATRECSLTSKKRKQPSLPEEDSDSNNAFAEKPSSLSPLLFLSSLPLLPVPTIKPRTYVMSSKMSPDQWKIFLTNIDPAEFTMEFLDCIYENDVGIKISPPDIDTEATVYGYSRMKFKLETYLHNGSEAVTIIPASAYNFGLDINQWDDNSEPTEIQDRGGKYITNQKTEEKIKSRMTVADRLKFVFKYNSEIYKQEAVRMAREKHDKSLTEREQRFNFGVYEERNLSYRIKVETMDLEKMRDTLVVAFIDKGVGKYTTIKPKASSKGQQQRLYWNCKLVNSKDVELRMIKGTDKYVYVSKELQVDGKGFDDGLSVAYYRVGDYLTMNEVCRIVDVCKDYRHCTAVFMAICCSHRLCEHFANKSVEREKASTPLISKRTYVKETVRIATDLMTRLKKKVIEHHLDFSIDDFVCCARSTWTIANTSHDKMYDLGEARRRRTLRKRAIVQMREETAYEGVSEETMIKDVGLLQYLLIMVIGKEVKDRTTESIFRRLNHNKTSLRSYFEPLKRMEWCELFEIHVEIIRELSLFTQRASCFLNILVVIDILFHGKIPRQQLLDIKETNIALNTQGERCHVEELLQACCPNGKLGPTEILNITEAMKAEPGAYINELAAEIGQSFSDRNKRPDYWAKWKIILEEFAEENPVYKRNLNRWLE